MNMYDWADAFRDNLAGLAILFFAALILFACILTSGCMGFGEGFDKQAQKMTSADYTIEHYKFFIDTYNSVRQMGTMIENQQLELNDFKEMHGPDAQYWSRTESNNYEELRFIKNGYISNYNLKVAEYNARMRDLTTSQVWMKPQNYPERLEMYNEKDFLTNNNAPLEIPPL